MYFGTLFTSLIYIWSAVGDIGYRRPRPVRLAKMIANPEKTNSIRHTSVIVLPPWEIKSLSTKRDYDKTIFILNNS